METADNGVFDQRSPRPYRISSLLRPIAFHPVLVDICDGSIDAGLMLSQILYWTPRCGPEADGWFYKTQQQWFEELRLTRTQQENARSILRSNGFIEESLRSCSAGTVKHFRACIDTIEAAMEPWQLSTRLQETNIPVCSKPANTPAGNLQRNKEQETTTETTTLNRYITRPTLEEISNYCKERKNSIDPQYFMDYYTANGWKVGRNSMKDWKAAVRTWEKNGKQKNDHYKTAAELRNERSRRNIEAAFAAVGDADDDAKPIREGSLF